MLPYWYADQRMAPCSVRTLGDVLHAAGFKHVRIVLQQWIPDFRPGAARLDGRPLDMLLVSAMQVHVEPAYELIRDAQRLGPARPLILVGGPKAIDEPTDYLEIDPVPGVGGQRVPQAFQDGNHVVASRHAKPWRRQLNLLLAYTRFYNPVNTVRTLLGLRKNSVSPKRFIYQIIGQIGLLLTIPKMLAWAWRLKRGPIEVWDGLQAARIPMVDASSGREIDWAAKRPPTLGQSDAPDATARKKDARLAGHRLFAKVLLPDPQPS